MNRMSLCLFMATKFVFCFMPFRVREGMDVGVPPMTFTILSGRWVGNTGCPAKSSTKGGHPIPYTNINFH
jgi:hypothetical protein